MADEDVPDELTCPVCFNLPEKEVYQCKDGHILCSKCYFKMKECPQCRRPLDKEEPIRNRHFEGQLVGFQKVDCGFKSNGCKQRIQKSLIEDHEKGCCFDLNKFGKFINLCRLINYDCKFRFNNGTAEEAVKHFTSVHGVTLIKKDKFRMEINFKEQVKNSSEKTQFWAPIITDLKDRKCFVLTMSIYTKKDDSFGWYSLYLPYLKNDNLSKFAIEYSVTDGNLNEPLKLSFLQEPVSISEVANQGAFILPRRFPAGLLEPYFTTKGDLLIKCIVRDKEVQEGKQEVFKCPRMKPLGPPRWNREEGSPAATKLLNQLISDCTGDSHRVKDDAFVEKLFSKENLAQLSSQDLNYLKCGALFAIAVFGTQMGFWRLFTTFPDLDINTKNGTGATALLCTMLDKDHITAQEKMTSLLGRGANVKVVDDKRRGMLHWAAWKGGEGAMIEVMTKELNLNAVDEDGKTPLHYVMMDDTKGLTYDKAMMLLQVGANPDLKDNDGKTPLDIAFQVKCKCRMQLRQMIQSFKKR